MEPSAPPFTHVRLLVSNDAAWKAKRHLIAYARQSLDLSYFILEVDGTTSQLMLDLVAAASRGVQVRLLVDYFTTFKQAPLLRLLGGVPELQVRRYGTPAPAWLAALDAAGIDSGAFVRGLMTTDRAMLVESLKGNILFPIDMADAVRALDPAPGEGAINFPLQVLDVLQGSSRVGPDPGTTRDAAVRKVALVIQILRGLKQFLHRNHHKLLLADGTRFVMGGRNLADAYHAVHPQQGHSFQDTDLLVMDRHEGGSTHARSFQVLWNSANHADIRATDPLDQRPAMTLAQLRRKAALAAAPPPGNAFRAGIRLPDMHGTLVDNLPAIKGDTSITQAYVNQIRRLIDHGTPAVVDIVTAYLFLDDDPVASASLLALRQALLDAADAGLTVNIYTNSLTSTDLKPINKAAYPKLLALIERGVNILELSAAQGSLHTKAAALGNHCLMVGSYNMDPRSELYDTNNLIVLYDPSGAATAAFRRTRIQALRWKLLTADQARACADASTAAVAARFTNSVL